MILLISLLSFSLFFPLDKISVVVGEKIILESSIGEQVEAFIASSSEPLNREEVRNRVVDFLVEQEVLVHFARKDTSLFVSPEQVNGVVSERLAFFKEQLGTVDALEDYFGVPYTDIKNILVSEAENMILADMFKQNLYSMVSMSNTEVEDFYIAYKDSLPLTPFLYSYLCIEKKVYPEESSLLEAERLAFSVLKKIKKEGKSFESFYDLYQGGDLGLFRRGTFIPEFEEVAFSLSPGELSSPVLSSLGYHLIRLNSRVGEKIDASHILFPLKIKESDNQRVIKQLKELSSPKYSVAQKDSIALTDKIVFGGVFNKAPEDQIPPSVLSFLKNAPTNGSSSDVFKTKEDLYSVLFLKEVFPPEEPDLYEYWGFVESLAFEKKFLDFYKHWYNKNKEKVYIKIY